jgi:hypothetical protein
MMDKSEKAFGLFAKAKLDEILKLQEEKGKGYSGGGDNNALTNFEQGSSAIGVEPQLYLMIMATKHWHSIGLWSSGKSKSLSSIIIERCMDVIVYMLLLMFMIELQKPEKGN